MTRINCVPPEELTRQHLLAEWRELPRVFKLAEAAYARGGALKEPARYTLGAGHVTFFYRRLAWCADRFYALKAEMARRGYVAGFEAPPQALIPDGGWWQSWEPDAAALALNRARIAQRLQEAAA